MQVAPSVRRFPASTRRGRKAILEQERKLPHHDGPGNGALSATSGEDMELRAAPVGSHDRSAQTLCRDCGYRPPLDVQTCLTWGSARFPRGCRVRTPPRPEQFRPAPRGTRRRHEHLAPPHLAQGLIQQRASSIWHRRWHTARRQARGPDVRLRQHAALPDPEAGPHRRPDRAEDERPRARAGRHRGEGLGAADGHRGTTQAARIPRPRRAGEPRNGRPAPLACSRW